MPGTISRCVSICVARCLPRYPAVVIRRLRSNPILNRPAAKHVRAPDALSRAVVLNRVRARL
jgi:hypothetical protein